MSKYTREHTYKGETIRPCEHAKGEHAGNWYVVEVHDTTGYEYADGNCFHYQTLREAREGIDAEIAYRRVHRRITS